VGAIVLCTIEPGNNAWAVWGPLRLGGPGAALENTGVRLWTRPRSTRVRHKDREGYRERREEGDYR